MLLIGLLVATLESRWSLSRVITSTQHYIAVGNPDATVCCIGYGLKFMIRRPLNSNYTNLWIKNSHRLPLTSKLSSVLTFDDLNMLKTIKLLIVST